MKLLQQQQQPNLRRMEESQDPQLILAQTLHKTFLYYPTRVSKHLQRELRYNSLQDLNHRKY